MNMASQILAMWAMSIVIPGATLVYIIIKFRMNDVNVGSLFDTVKGELDACRERESKLSSELHNMKARISELEKLAG